MAVHLVRDDRIDVLAGGNPSVASSFDVCLRRFAGPSAAAMVVAGLWVRSSAVVLDRLQRQHRDAIAPRAAQVTSSSWSREVVPLLSEAHVG